jgi:FdhE protein
LPGLLPKPAAIDELHCPSCGGLPGFNYFGVSGEALVTAPRYLVCSRCSTAWVFERMVCASCGETDTSKLPIYSDTERFGNLRIDGCQTCRRYLVTVELPKDTRAVPVVDELAAIPLDLYAQDRGMTKLVPNLMGI